MRITPLLTAGFLFTGLSPHVALALDAPEGIATGDTTIGEVLVDAKGMTLYAFDQDSSGSSACYGKCAENWPPLEAAASTSAVGEFTVITRDDGKSQWTYKGKPLYLWVRDQAPGDTTGDGVRGWNAARP